MDEKKEHRHDWRPQFVGLVEFNDGLQLVIFLYCLVEKCYEHNVRLVRAYEV